MSTIKPTIDRTSRGNRLLAALPRSAAGRLHRWRCLVPHVGSDRRVALPQISEGQEERRELWSGRPTWSGSRYPTTGTRRVDLSTRETCIAAADRGDSSAFQRWSEILLTLHAWTVGRSMAHCWLCRISAAG